jgi:general secretion pathway protein G
MNLKFKIQNLMSQVKNREQKSSEKKSFLVPRYSSSASGFTLLELIITLTVLAILVMGTIPIAQNAVIRQREMRLRENLRTIRSAIDEFHRDTIGACQQGGGNIGPIGQIGQLGGAPADPRSRVVIADCELFDSENLDRYPPDLETLVEGVEVKGRGMNIQQNGAFSDKNATELNEEKELKKVYLRELPIDPMTGEADWNLRSSYQTEDDGSWDEINVFDVRSNSDGEGLNDEKYSDW